jgi:deazaflavin-dependent oxidoreductase (nitroreductase family)
MSAGLLALAAQARPADGDDVSVSGIGQALRRLAQRLGGTRLGVLAIGRIVSPLQRELYRRTGGRLSLTGRAPVLLLTTTGRRTGKARTVPLLYLRDGDHLVICNVNPGFEQPNPWVLNLLAQPYAQIQLGRNTTSVSARSASDEELHRYWPQLTKLWPAYQDFYNNGGKRSVFVLQPDGPLQRVPRAQPSSEKTRHLMGRTLRKLRAFAARPEQIEGVAGDAGERPSLPAPYQRRRCH